MSEKVERLIGNLNGNDAAGRLGSLKTLISMTTAGDIEKPEKTENINNHIHTAYSFSPYSPSKAIWIAYRAGLSTAGIMDHDSIGGACEFIEAGRIAGMPTTIGVECRADFSGTPLKGRRINNPDQDSIAYVALHGIPHGSIGAIREYFRPYTEFRNIRNMRIVDNINAEFRDTGIRLDFEKDVIPLSMFKEGGSITERHILYALSLSLIDKFGRGSGLLGFLRAKFGMAISGRLEGYLTDKENPFYPYDLLGLLKSELVGRIYIDADKECPDVREIIELSQKTGAIAAYAYLGDVGESVTGDKKSQTFEDGYTDLLFKVLKELGFNAVTYMPSRNSTEQLDRVRSLCGIHGFFQISGEDINSPRQPFICEALKERKYRNLIDSTWALIGHERLASADPAKSMFSPETIRNLPDLADRIRFFGEAGRRPEAGSY